MSSIVRVLKGGRGSRREADATLLDLKMKEGATSQRIWLASGGWKKQEEGFSPRTS